MEKIKLSRAIDFISSGVNQRGTTLLLGTQSIVQYLNIAAMNIYFFEGKNWAFMRHKETFTVPVATDELTTYESDLDYDIISLHSVNSDDVTLTQKNSDFDMSIGDFYIEGFNNKIVFARGTTAFTVEIIYFGFNLFPESSTPDLNATIEIPEIFLPALYHFTLSLIYPHYTQYGDANQASAYQMGMNYLTNISKSSNTILNFIKPS